MVVPNLALSPEQCAKDINGKPVEGFTEDDLQRMIEILEGTGRFDVSGRRW